jgi:hypothetical protein
LQGWSRYIGRLAISSAAVIGLLVAMGAPEI